MLQLNKEEVLKILHALNDARDHMVDCAVACEDLELRDDLDYFEVEMLEAMKILEDKMPKVTDQAIKLSDKVS